MPTDAGDVAGIAGSTMAGAAAGSVFGPWGTFIGGGIGFITGLFGNSAENAAEDLSALQMQREKIAAGIMGEARETGLILNALAVDRTRSQYAQKAFLGSEAINAAGALTGLMGSSITRNARASMGQQRASGLQFSMLTEQLGNQISQLQQDAVNAKLGITTGSDLPIPDDMMSTISETTYNSDGEATNSASNPGGLPVMSAPSFMAYPSLEAYYAENPDQMPADEPTTKQASQTTGRR